MQLVDILEMMARLGALCLLDCLNNSSMRRIWHSVLAVKLDDARGQSFLEMR